MFWLWYFCYIFIHYSCWPLFESTD